MAAHRVGERTHGGMDVVADGDVRAGVGSVKEGTPVVDATIDKIEAVDAGDMDVAAVRRLHSLQPISNQEIFL